MRRRFRRPLTQLSLVRNAAATFAVALFVPLAATAATPLPSPSEMRVDVTKLQQNIPLPKTKLHSEFVVEVNRKGQVVRVRSGKSSGNAAYNAQTYGNALQAFIRKPDGSVVIGSYRLTYDFNPATGRVRRDVSLVKAGGVNPDARSAVEDMEEVAKRHTPEPIPEHPTPNVVPSVKIDNQRLPDLPQVMHSPTH
jgi:hypothetical protein